MATPQLIRGYEVVIGIETHAQLSTQSKIFSGSSTAFGADPNTQACAVDLALPGTLPVLNRGAVERAIRTSGEDMVRGGIAEAIRPSRQIDGSYAFANAWRFLLSRV